MDKVFIRDFEIQTRIGVFDWERLADQTLRIDLEMASDVAKAAESDDIVDALDYKSIVDRINEYAKTTEFQLIETMAEGIARIIIDEFKVSWLKLTLHKPDIFSGSTDVGVEIERTASARI